MHTTKSIQKFGQREMQASIADSASWHQDYAQSSYVFIANLHYEMTEGDIAIVFSQYGEPVDVHLVRNKKTGQSRGFCFLAYEDQRSTSLAVDNFNAADVCGRTLRVDHVKEFKPPKEYLQIKDDDPDFFDKLYKPSGPDGKGWGSYREQTEEEKQLAQKLAEMEKQKDITNEKILDNLNDLQNQKIVLDAEERWEKILMEQMDNEQEQMKQKIEQLRIMNEAMVKPAKQTEPKKKVIQQETNAEQKARLLKEQSHKHHAIKKDKHEKKSKHKKSDKVDKKDKDKSKHKE